MTQIYDELQMLMNLGDYVINDYIKIRQPTVGDVARMGERKYYSVLSAFTAIPSDLKYELYEQGLNWYEVSDFELFIMLTRGIPLEDSRMFFGDYIDFTKFDLCLHKETQLLFLQDPNGVRIDFNIHRKIAKYLQGAHGIVPKVEKPLNKSTAKFMIQEARDKLKYEQSKPYEPMLKNLVSSMVNSAGFKYDYSTIGNLGMFAFMDAVKRISCIVSTQSLMNGAYSGNIDTSKIDKNQFDWMRDLNPKPKRFAGKQVTASDQTNNFNFGKGEK